MVMAFRSSKGIARLGFWPFYKLQIKLVLSEISLLFRKAALVRYFLALKMAIELFGWAIFRQLDFNVADVITILRYTK